MSGPLRRARHPLSRKAAKNMPSSSVRIAAELAAAVVLYRFSVSPLVRWGSRGLASATRRPAPLHGAYPERPLAAGDLARVCAVAGPVTLGALTVAAPPGDVGLVPTVALLLALWKCLTLDYDIARELGPQRADRLIALALGLTALLLPPLRLLAVIWLCGRLGAWTHHSMACLRIVKASFAWSLVTGAAALLVGASPADEDAGMLVLLGSVFLSHYVVAFRSKWRLAGNPWAWAARNRTDFLVACAYVWGWGRFLPRPVARRVVVALAPWTVVLNTATMLVQGMGLIAFLNRWVFLAAVLGAVLFNVVVALFSGLLFWDNIAIGVALALVAARLHEQAPAFGPVPWLTSAVILTLVLRGWAWKPTGLGWWDTPFAARVHWTATLEDGRRVGVYNNLLCPYDREFGRSVGNPLTTERFVTFTMGGVQDSAIRDRLLGLRSGGRELRLLKDRHGESHWDPDFRQRHVEYLKRFFARLGSGTQKSPLPRAVRWLKAPGSHLYYWGALPGYRRKDGPVTAVQVHYQEVLFSPDRRDWLSVRDTLLFEIDVASAPGHPH